MKKNMVFATLMIGILVFVLTACGAKDSGQDGAQDSTAQQTQDIAPESPEETAQYDTDWSIYWYLCGSDLESEGGSATIDLLELSEVTLPENVKIIIQTGGSSRWDNEMVSPDYIERYIFDSDGLRLLEQQPLASMGSAETLSGFLAYAKENYPANKTGFIFWNHGGGSVDGAAFDENFDNDSLTLSEMSLAFGQNYELSAENPPFDLIGFDTCLMATVDVANTFSNIGEFMVASEETEPANGWHYTGWADALGKNPAMDALELGTIICDTYAYGCEIVGTADNITLSVTNLSKVPALVAAYDDFGKEALASVCTDTAFFSNFGRIASVTENYGGNTKEQGFTNMTDLGHLARQSAEILPQTSATVLAALESCVEYKVNGPYRAESTGLSCYYSYDGDVDDLVGYLNEGTGEAFKYYYAYGLTGELSDEGMKYISEMSFESLPPLETLESQGWENHALEVDDEGAAVLTLGENAADVLSGIYIQLYYVDPETDTMYLLGGDNDLIGDWETGVFKDNFRGVWGSIDGNLVNMELSFEGEGYNLYSVPILLNGEEYNLMVVYDFESAAYEIQGAKKPIDENGMADKNLRYLIEGDVITIIQYVTSISGESDELTPYEAGEIIVSSEMSFEEAALGDGIYLQMFDMRDMQGYTAYSDVIMFEIADGAITTSVGFTD